MPLNELEMLVARYGHHVVRWLGQPERSGEDTMAWTLLDRGAQPIFCLAIANETRRVRVRPRTALSRA